MENRPNGRKTNVTGTGSGLGRKGSVGGGPAGRPGGYSGRTGGGQGAGGGVTRAGGLFKSPILIIIIAAVVLLGGGGGLLSGLLGGNSSSGGLSNIGNLIQTVVPSLSSLGNGVFSGGSSVSTGWDKDSDNGVLDTTVASGSRAKRTVIKGGGADTVTIMVYMCGTDLESKHGMASADMEEMRRATISFGSFILGMPYISRPPARSAFSKTVTECPCRFRRSAQASPEGPLPTTAADFPVLVSGIRG